MNHDTRAPYQLLLLDTNTTAFFNTLKDAVAAEKNLQAAMVRVVRLFAYVEDKKEE